MNLSRAKLFIAFAGMVAIVIGLAFYDWRWACIGAGGLLIAATIGKD